MPTRLDKLLVNRELVETRSRARDLIKRDGVKVNGEIVSKPSAIVSDDIPIELIGNGSNYVSRGALKLKAAINHFAINPENAVALDLGSSTGGFSQVLLEYGASKVYSIYIGHNQLHHSLKGNPAIISLEGQDIRKLTRDLIPDQIDIITSDLSFISQTQALLPALTYAKPDDFLISLIKPQFEVGRDGVGKGGIVRYESTRQAAIEKVTNWISTQTGWDVLEVIPSPIKGQGGNQEYLLGAKYHG